MHEISMIEDPVAAEASLDPLRRTILAALTEPGSASTIAARLGIPRQKVNYHVKVLEQHGLIEPDLGRVASWWHTDADLGREIEVVTDISKSRLAGFTLHHRTVDSFTALFDRYRAEKLIP